MKQSRTLLVSWLMWISFKKKNTFFLCYERHQISPRLGYYLSSFRLSGAPNLMLGVAYSGVRICSDKSLPAWKNAFQTALRNQGQVTSRHSQNKLQRSQDCCFWMKFVDKSSSVITGHSRGTSFILPGCISCKCTIHVCVCVCVKYAHLLNYIQKQSS